MSTRVGSTFVAIVAIFDGPPFAFVAFVVFVVDVARVLPRVAVVVVVVVVVVLGVSGVVFAADVDVGAGRHTE